MELYQLRSFAAVAEIGHLTRAAERLHISQPALSAQIKALEDEWGLSLFERSSTGMLLTPAGRQLLAEAEKVLHAAQALRAAARTLAGEVVGNVRIGTVSDPEFIRVGELLNAAVERYPRLQIALHQEVSGEAFEQVRRGELDASFYFGELTHPAVAGVPLGDITYRVVAPAAWWDRMAHAAWSELAAMPWIMTPSSSTHNQLVNDLFRGHGVVPAQVVVADQESLISTLVVAGVGLALMREDMARAKVESGEVCVWRNVRVSTPLWFIYPAERRGDPLIEALLSVLREVWGVAEPAEAPPPRRARRG